jgi:putative glutamate/gamma-aminobutyrate antiporter
MNLSNSSSRKALTIFSLVMINVIAVDSLRNLTAGAEYGFALIFFYILAAVLFFIPTLLITAELATAWPNTGGVYIWVREAFGSRAGFLTIWLQWIYNVIWYPTILAFIAGILAYLIMPGLVNNKIFMFCVVVSAFWLTTLVNCLHLKAANWVSGLGAIMGTIVPMLFIAGLGIVWIYLGKPSQIHFRASELFPNMIHVNNLAFFTNILFSLMGMEMCAVHAGDVQNPSRDYPRALLFSALIIISTLILSSLAITLVIPAKQLNLVSGLIEAFGIFFQAYHMSWFVPIIAAMIIVGSLAGTSAWILGPARGLLMASKDNKLPNFLTKENKSNMPIGILITQGVIVTFLCLIFLMMPSVNSSYWVLSNLTAQLALLFYILMFAAAIYLRYKYPNVKRIFKIPGGLWGISIVGGVGIFTCIGAIILGFFPPSQVAVGSVAKYEIMLIGGIIVCCAIPFLFSSKRYATVKNDVI